MHEYEYTYNKVYFIDLLITEFSMEIITFGSQEIFYLIIFISNQYFGWNGIFSNSLQLLIKCESFAHPCFLKQIRYEHT